MAIRCNRKGGFGLKVEDKNGRITRLKIVYGINDISDELIGGALRRMPEKMAEALTSLKPNGAPADLEPVRDFDAEPEGDDDGGERKLSAAEKVKLVRAAETLAELRELNEGEDRSTVIDAIEKRAAQIQAADETQGEPEA